MEVLERRVFYQTLQPELHYLEAEAVEEDHHEQMEQISYAILATCLDLGQYPQIDTIDTAAVLDELEIMEIQAVVVEVVVDYEVP